MPSTVRHRTRTIAWTSLDKKRFFVQSKCSCSWESTRSACVNTDTPDGEKARTLARAMADNYATDHRVEMRDAQRAKR